MSHVTFSQFAEAGRSVIDAVPEDFTYKGCYGNVLCMYVNYPEREGQPACLVARILAKLGVPLELLQALDAVPTDDSSFGGHEVRGLLEDAGWTFDSHCFEVGTAAQRAQDSNVRWHSIRPMFEPHLDVLL